MVGSYQFLYKCTLEKTPVKLCSGISLDNVDNTLKLNKKVFEWLSSSDKKAVAVRNLMDSRVSVEDVLKNLEKVYSRKTKDTRSCDIKVITELVKRVLMDKENGKSKYTVREAIGNIIQMGFSRENVALGIAEFIKDNYFEE